MSIDKPGTAVVECPQCRRSYRLPRAAVLPGRSLRCTKCGFVFKLQAPAAPRPEPGGPRVLVASDGDEVRAIIEEVLLQKGFAPRLTRSGDEALELIEGWGPKAAVLDVGIGGVPVFEICDRVRSHPLHNGLAIILLASVFQHTRYKRSPTSLYGADDYIEKHHLRDSLVSKIERLLPGREGEPSPTGAAYPPPAREEERRREASQPVEDEQREGMTMVREERFGSAADQGADTARDESLRRFARIIMADIALYNQELVEQGVREGNLQSLLASEIEEGRHLFETRITGDHGSGLTIYRQAIEDFIGKQRARFQGRKD